MGDTYDQIADENLQDLSLQTGATSEDLLENADEDVTQRGGNEHAVQRHLGDARAEVVAVLADIVGEPRGEEFLQTREHTRGEHLGAQRVLLQLAEIGLRSTFLGSVGASIGDGAFGHFYIPPDSRSGSFHRSIAHRRDAPDPPACRRHWRPRGWSPPGT